MENYIQNIALINDYLNKRLSESEIQNFENLLKTDSNFNTLFDEHKVFLEGLKRQQLKVEILNAKHMYIKVKWMKFLGISGSIIIVSILTYMLLFNNKTIEPIYVPENNNSTIIIDSVSTRVYEEAEVVIMDTLSRIDKEEVQKVEILEKKETETELKFTEPSKKTAQIFAIDFKKDTTIVCTEGTKLFIKANSFVDEQGNTIQGDINLEVTEFYKLSDMLLANLSTTSNGEQLETGGMLFVEAKKDEKNLMLDENSSIEISFPTKIKKENMQLFSGKWENDIINWQLQKKTEEIIVVEVGEVEMDTVYTSVRGQVEHIREVMHDKDFQVDSTFIKTWETYTKNKLIRFFGENNNVILRKSLFEMKNTMFKVLHDDSISRGGHVIRKPWDESQIPTTSRIMRITPKRQIYVDNEMLSEEEFKSRLQDEDDIIITTADVNNYVLKTTNLGWINCDRFIRNKSRIKYKLKIKNVNDAAVSMVFRSLNSVLPSRNINGIYDFGTVAKDESITLVAIKKQNGKLYLDILDTKTEEDPDLEFNFKEVSLEEMKSELKKLNKWLNRNQKTK